MAGFDLEVVDVEQLVVRGRLMLSVLVTQPSDDDRLAAVVSDLAADLALDVAIEHGTGDNRPRRIGRANVTVLGHPLEPAAMAANIAAARRAYAAAGRDPAALAVTAEVSLDPPRKADGRADWNAVYDQAARLVATGVDTLATHLVPQCRDLGEVEPYLRGFIAAVQEASLGVEPA